ncbi:FlgD immunoglobulin-like domain containing protein [Fulvivirgaceae bacterium BMA10]|uniref:FlgD immunoglobulin-like domain containing protein n=1 Tax=Splendidivirga corallicola TaxID=3051826 RepID=A0ABT8KHC8_9BACT|nr:FlgD immunoglobulin-like domain containing protein [Fulvivirgaceae bacterium BMA10]
MKEKLRTILFTLIIISSILIIVESNKNTESDISEWAYYEPLDLSLVEAKSEYETKENPQARLAYETAMIVDPRTGSVPEDFRRKEIGFNHTLPTRGKSDRNTRRKGLREISATPWQARGPENIGGRTRALAIDIANENIILAGGVSGGMWRSENGGQSWNKVTGLESLQSVTSIAQDIRPGKTNIWYYGTGELSGNSARGGGGAIFRGDGIFKSTDGGITWNLLTSTSGGEPNQFSEAFQFVWNIKVNENNPFQDEVLAATFGGIQRSTDGGNTWSFVLGEESNDGSFYTDIAISSGVMIATLSQSSIAGTATTRGVFRSTDGSNWTNITPQSWPQEFDRTVVAIAPSNPNVAYFISDTNPNHLWKYTYLSGDGTGAGGKWQDLSSNIPSFGGEVGDFDSQGSYNMLLKVHPTNENMVFLGGTNLYVSDDGFASPQGIGWIGGYNITNDISQYPNHHADQHALVFFPSDPRRAISGHDGGISFTDNINNVSVNWQSLNNGYITSQFYALDIDQTPNSQIIVGGMQDNGSYIANASGNWISLLGGDGAYSAVGNNGKNLYVSSQNSRIIRYFDDGSQLIPVSRVDPIGAGNVQDQEYLFINPFVLDPVNNGKMYLAGGDKIWRNNNVPQIPGTSDSTSVNWSDLPTTTIQSGQISSLAISREPRNVLYFGTTEGEVYRVDNAHSIKETTTNITSNIFPEEGYVSCVEIDPLNANNVVVIFSNYNVQSIFYSQDGGNNFQSISGNLEENQDGSGNGPSIRWAKIVPLQGEQYLYLIATSTGVYSTTQLNGDQTVWAQEGPDIIGNVVVNMIRYRSSDGTVVIGTHGNGVYSKVFDNVLDLSMETSDPVYSLDQNFPNPFSEHTTIKFSLPSESVGRIKIFDAQGKSIRTILLARQFPGENEVIWDGNDAEGTPVANGVYYYRLDFGINTFNSEKLTKKMILVR